MGHKSVNQDGFAVMLTPDEPMLGSIHCDLDLRCGPETDAPHDHGGHEQPVACHSTESKL